MFSQILKLLPLQKFKLSGHSMEPTLPNGSTVIASPLPYIFSEPIDGDIIAFSFENKIFVKRIKNIEDKKYFVSGDNPSDSYDSRTFGLIKKKNIIGKVLLKISP